MFSASCPHLLNQVNPPSSVGSCPGQHRRPAGGGTRHWAQGHAGHGSRVSPGSCRLWQQFHQGHASHGICFTRVTLVMAAEFHQGHAAHGSRVSPGSCWSWQQSFTTKPALAHRSYTRLYQLFLCWFSVFKFWEILSSQNWKLNDFFWF